MQGNLLDKDRSLQLGLLKLLSCIGVVYIHAYRMHCGFSNVTAENFTTVYYIQSILSQYIARAAVPVFFAISGYIYAAKQYQESNLQFCLRKARGILWPYILWNSIALFYIFLAQIPDFTRSCFREDLIVTSFTVERWISAYFGWQDGWFPFLYPLWFLPYLFAAFMIVHILRKYLDKYVWLIGVLALINIVCSSYMPFKSYCVHYGPFLRIIYAVSFFTLGSLLLKYRTWVDKKSAMMISGIVFAAVCTADLMDLTPAFDWKTFSSYSAAVFIFSAVTGINRCSEKIKKSVVFLSGFSFLIYVTHEFAMTVMGKLIYPAVPHTVFYMLLLYFGIPVLLISALILGGYCLKKLLPGVYDFLFRTS